MALHFGSHVASRSLGAVDPIPVESTVWPSSEADPNPSKVRARPKTSYLALAVLPALFSLASALLIPIHNRQIAFGGPSRVHTETLGT
jgi:hypothetical protein